ncbi:MAG: dephospho-CoA kinase, partial [Planctomycetaceae bacterium]|nr:dephospho-CoA kinase [Planctomycetaceae bacterium]
MISLIGGIGSGKSALSQELAKRHSVLVINADKIGHEVLTEPDVIAQLKMFFGPNIVNASGEIVRSRVADLVFGDAPEQKTAHQQLEETVHPRIRSRIEQKIHNARNSSSCDLIILDAALLLEADWDRVCDLIFFIDVSEETRLQRVQQNRNWTEEEFRKREQNQLGLLEKQKRADYTIENNSSLTSAVDQLETYLKQHFQTGPR